MTNAEEQELEQQVRLDLQFQEKLIYYDKHALAQVLAHIGHNESTRAWVLQVLDSIQDLTYKIGGYGSPAITANILQQINIQVQELVKKEGPSALNSHSVEELTEKISGMALQADNKAGQGNNLAALNLMLECAIRIVYGLAEHLEYAPEITQQTSAPEEED